MDIKQYDEARFSNEWPEWVWKNNKSLKVLDFSNAGGNEADEESFAHDLYLINNENVRYMTLSCFCWDDAVFKIISRFDQIERLELLRVATCISDPEKRNQLRMSHSNLKHISSNNDISDLMNIFCHQLESVDFGALEDDSLYQCTFPKLYSLSCIWNHLCFRSFKETKTLKKVSVWFHDINPIGTLFKLMANQTSLQHLEVSFENFRANSSNILQAIETAMLRYDMRTKKISKFDIHFEHLPTGDQNKALGLQICKIFNACKVGSAFTFTIRYFGAGMDMDDAGLTALDDLQSTCSVSFNEAIESEFKLVIAPR